MLPVFIRRCWPVLVLAIALAAEPAAASAGADWLPTGTDIVLTFNFRQFLEDHKHTDAIQGQLEPWQLALRGDEKSQRRYYRSRDLGKVEGVTEREFLERARLMKSASDSLGFNPLADVDRITCGFRRSSPQAWLVIADGRFQQDRLRKSFEWLARETASSFKATLVNRKTLAIAGCKDPLAELAARAGGKKRDALAPERRALLEQGEKQHVAVFFDRVNTLLTEEAMVWMDEAARALGVGDEAIAKFAMSQVVAWTRRYGKDIVCANVGLTVRGTELNLQIGLLAHKPATAKALATRLDGARVLAAFAAKAADNEWGRQLGDILLAARVSASDALVAIHIAIPHAFVQTLAEDGRTTPHPRSERLRRLIMSIPLWRPLAPPAPGAVSVQEVREIAYRNDAAADPIRHRLDLFLPRGTKNYPVVVLVHGGGWDMGDNRCCGLYSSVGHFLASQGIGAVLPNYRLSPAVAHPEHVKDVARAVRWTRDHIAGHGGNPDRIFLFGHSAGGHLVSLLATDESYLKADRLTARDIKGVIAASGVYRIRPGTMEAFLGGTDTQSIRPDQMFPLRGEIGRMPMLPALGIRIKSDVFGPAFSADAKIRAAASPINHVRRDLPPFLLLAAENDLPTLAEMAAEFHKTLLRAGCAVRLLTMKERNHNSLLFSIIRADDPAARAVLTFLRRH
jgi:acetyl esterase/lipase